MGLICQGVLHTYRHIHTSKKRKIQMLNLFTVDSQGDIAEKTEQNPFRGYNNVQSTVTKEEPLFYFHS